VPAPAPEPDPSPPPAATATAPPPPTTVVPGEAPNRATTTLATSAGDLRITAIQHGTVMFEHGGLTWIVDPWSKGNLAGLPKADVLLLTDIHPDHFDPPGIDAVRKEETTVVAPASVSSQLHRSETIANGETQEIRGVTVEAIPMYNLVRGPNDKEKFHTKGRGNGYVLTFGGKRVYVSGDTECTPEMKALKNIDVAFVCMNLPYTMPPAEVATCVKAFRPKVLIPYHYRGQDVAELQAALKGQKGIELRAMEFYPGGP
jgi:L-ascorbate metabolism protein UlaG (beta-lactamase superfamily)